MERDTKRKAGDASPESEARPSKRQKLPNNNEGVVETAETTAEVGLKFIETLKQARDKHGRHIATHFLALPSKDELPEYYEQVLLPIAITTIETKLHERKYPNLAAVESDIKRMVNNAKSFNDKKSLIYEDAERVRKTASNFMTKHNPAYKDPSYIAVPTPLPTDKALPGPKSGAKEDGPAAPGSERRRRAAAPSNSNPPRTQASRRRASRHESVASGQGSQPKEFQGKSFQEAQDQIITDLIQYKDESGLEVFTPFLNLPSRSLTDYYALIKNPMSLKGVQKKVRGVHGRNQPTWVTDLKSWDAFETEVSYIWHNAREYNEDGSEIFNLAGDLEKYFKGKLAQAKSEVGEPPQPTLKLKMSAPKPSIKLRFGTQKESPTPAPAGDASSTGRQSATPGLIVDAKALEGQQQHVQPSVNGQRPSTASSTAQTPVADAQNTADSRASLPPDASAASPPATTNGVKTEVQGGQSPTLTDIRPTTAASNTTNEGQGPNQNAQAPQRSSSSSMPPPTGPLRPASGSPHPQQPTVNGHTSSLTNVPPQHAPSSGLGNKRRVPGKTPADYIMPMLTVSTHPGLALSRPFSLNIMASSTLTQQSRTLTLPSTHYYLQLVPNLPLQLLVRPYRVFVTVNNHRMMEVPRVGREREKTRPLFEAKLLPGLNRIEVEVVAGVPKMPGKTGPEQVESEKVLLFVNLLKP